MTAITHAEIVTGIGSARKASDSGHFLDAINIISQLRADYGDLAVDAVMRALNVGAVALMGGSHA